MSVVARKLPGIFENSRNTLPKQGFNFLGSGLSRHQQESITQHIKEHVKRYFTNSCVTLLGAFFYWGTPQNGCPVVARNEKKQRSPLERGGLFFVGIVWGLCRRGLFNLKENINWLFAVSPAFALKRDITGFCF